MPTTGPHRLRIKLPNGAELEAEGSQEFVQGERREFTELQIQRPPGKEGAAPERPVEPPWEGIIETRGSGNIQLRAKFGGESTEKEACLVLIAASRALLRTPKPTAAQIARWLRASGYPIARVDRALQGSLAQGEILASGSRRARRYELSGPGLAKAFRLGHQLSAFIRPGP